MPRSTSERRRALYDEAVALIAADCGDSITIDAVARRVGTSRRQLQRCFAEAGRGTFRAHVAAARMERAAMLLATQGLPVGSIAHLVGFRDPSQFTKSFRRHHAVAPTVFRQSIGAGEAAGGRAAG